ncbi:MAG: proline--tRNA ligase [Lachnospiraceae bacterium]|nr:proline--tRNA ligase [Lachnospiraceae bacterium]
MKIANMVGDRFKERPSDCVVDSHAFSVRGGYVKYVAGGIYSLYPPMRRITKKIENIIREEMDSIGGQEVLFPVVLPGSMWEESGRYESVGDELLRFKDRNGSKMVLGMTHEEAAVQLVREYGQTYTKYPFMIYQIQTKFRDEARPRAGLIRVREFTMKDAYSFHTSQEDLEKYYDVCYKAYNRIFQKAGVPEVIAVKSDSGMMGGSVSHEYMLLADAGEDSIVICTDCGYKANMEAAENKVDNSEFKGETALEKVHTPNSKTIEEVTEFLGEPVEKSCKAVMYQKNMTDEYVVVFLRGDYEVNETKLTNYLGEEVHPAEVTEESGIVAGFTGPYNFNAKATVIFDSSLDGMESLVCGANETDYHYKGLNIKRDLGDVEFVDVAKIKTGGICPCCGKKTITVKRGIEVGNIFQLGTKYTKAMNMKYTDVDGTEKNPIMGCYGIGVGRLAASVCEARHDDNGPIWPITIAPWQVHLCCMRVDQEECKNAADDLYEKLMKAGVEVIYDDRDIRAGAMFADADLLGVPVRVVVGPKALANGELELSSRDKSIKKNIPVDSAVEEIKKVIDEMFADIYSKVED